MALTLLPAGGVALACLGHACGGDGRQARVAPGVPRVPAASSVAVPVTR
jgi:hypothetical protein